MLLALLVLLAPPPGKTVADVLAAAKASDWRSPDPDNTLVMDVKDGRVVIELAARMAPHHVANIELLVREGYFDGLAFMRSQDNYVVQWGDADGKRKPKSGKPTLAAEFTQPFALPRFVTMDERDVYAPEIGFIDDFPAARDPKLGQAWLAHCYGMVGAGRDDDADSGGGVELYAVIGHAPRHLDRNVTLVGRVLQGMELLSVLPRGVQAMGFYDRPEQRAPITRIRVLADVPQKERPSLEVLRTDTPTFTAYIEAKKNRRESWFKAQAGHVDLCNALPPVRARP